MRSLGALARHDHLIERVHGLGAVHAHPQERKLHTVRVVDLPQQVGLIGTSYTTSPIVQTVLTESDSPQLKVG